jgi:hypothetical protein
LDGEQAGRVSRDTRHTTHTSSRRQDTVCLTRGWFWAKKRGLRGRSWCLESRGGPVPLKRCGVKSRPHVQSSATLATDPGQSSTGVGSYMIGRRLYQRGEMCTDGDRGPVRCRGVREGRPARPPPLQRFSVLDGPAGEPWLTANPIKHWPEV